MSMFLSLKLRTKLRSLEANGGELCQVIGTGSPHFTGFHFAHSSLYTRFMIVPNEFTLCNALHDFLTLYVKRSREKWHLLACTTEKTKEKVKSNLDLPLYLEVIEIDQECEYRTCANRTAPF